MPSRRVLTQYLLYPLIGALFVVLAVGAILYARGYEYDFSRHLLEKTGLILVSSKPSGARVTLDSKRLGGKTPAKLQHLLPNTYHLAVAKTGFRIWEKDLPVLAERVTFAQYLVLYPIKLHPRHVAGDQVINAMTVPPDQGRIIYTTDGGAALWRMSSDGTSRKRLLDPANPSPALIASGEHYALSLVNWSDDSSRLLIQKQGDHPGYWILDGDALSVISDLVPTDATTLQYDPADARDLYYLRGGSLFRVNVPARSTTSPILTDVSAYRADRTGILSVRTVSATLGWWRTGRDGSGAVLLAKKLAAGSYATAYSNASSAAALVGGASGLLLIPDGSGGTRRITLPGSFTDLSWNRTGDRLFVWDRSETGSYDLVLKQFFRRPTLATLTGARVTPDGAHLDLTEGDGLASLVEFDSDNPLPLGNIASGSLYYLPSRHGVIYLSRQGALESIDLERT